jgi:hypothetical protein
VSGQSLKILDKLMESAGHVDVDVDVEGMEDDPAHSSPSKPRTIAVQEDDEDDDFQDAEN